MQRKPQAWFCYIDPVDKLKKEESFNSVTEFERGQTRLILLNDCRVWSLRAAVQALICAPTVLSDISRIE